MKTGHVVVKNVLVSRVKAIAIVTLIVRLAFFAMTVWTIVEQIFLRDLTVVKVSLFTVA